MSKEDSNQTTLLNVGDRILRCWSDGKEYPAIVFKKTAIHYMLYYRETNELEEVLVTSFEEGSEWRRHTSASTADSNLAADIKGTVDQRNTRVGHSLLRVYPPCWVVLFVLKKYGNADFGGFCTQIPTPNQYMI